MTTVKGTLAYGSILETKTTLAGALISSQSLTNNSAGQCKGFQEYRSPEPSGSFTPGKFRVNAVTMEKRNGFFSTASFKFHDPNLSRYYAYEGDYAGYWMAPSLRGAPSWPTQMANSCVLRAQSKMQSVDADVALMLAELKETLAMLRNPIKGFLNFLANYRKAVRSGNLLGRVRESGSLLADAWLMNRYGIIPFIRDIQSLIDAYEAKAKRCPGLLTKRSGFEWDTDEVPSSPLTSVYCYMNARKDYRRRIHHKMMAYTYGEILAGAPPLSAANKYGFNPTMMPSLAWEIVPYSFVVDWIMNVGDWLRAIMPLFQASYLGTCVSYKTTLEVTVDVTYISNYPSYLISVGPMSPGKGTWSVERLERRIIQSTPVAPALNIHRIGFTQMMDSLALLWQQIPRR